MKTTSIQTSVNRIELFNFIDDDKVVNKMTIHFNDEFACYVANESDGDYLLGSTSKISNYRASLIALLCQLDKRFGIWYDSVKHSANLEAKINAALVDANVEIDLIHLEKDEKVQTKSGEYIAPRAVIIPQIKKIEFVREVDKFLSDIRMSILNSIDV